MSQQMKRASTMRTILATTLLGASLMTALATQSGAADNLPANPHNAIVNVAAADYDDPAFGSPRWWEQQEDRGG
jgi:hypothetical protein